MISFFEPCVFPTTTAQMKRYSAKTGRYFHSPEQEAAINTIASILAPHRPAQPICGAVKLEVWTVTMEDGTEVTVASILEALRIYRGNE